MICSVSLVVNGAPQVLETHPMRRLLDVLREDLHLTGTKEGCGEGECGACAVLLDGKLVNSCLIPAIDASDCHVLTIEGVSQDTVRPIQKAFISAGAAQCGMCTPGMIMASLVLLENHPQPTLEQIREGLAGNLCRCTGYIRIFEAIQAIGPPL